MGEPATPGPASLRRPPRGTPKEGRRVLLEIQRGKNPRIPFVNSMFGLKV